MELHFATARSVYVLYSQKPADLVYKLPKEASLIINACASLEIFSLSKQDASHVGIHSIKIEAEFNTKRQCLWSFGLVVYT